MECFSSALFFIMLTVIKHLLTIMRAKKVWGRDLLLIICLCIGMLTPIMQLSSSLRACALHKTHVLYLDPENVNGTFEGKDVIAYRNFLAVHYKNSFSINIWLRIKNAVCKP